MAPVTLDIALSLKGRRLGDALLALAEDQWFNRKSGRIAVKDLTRPLIAFANAEGGTIVVGLSKGIVDGITPKQDNALRQAAADFTVPPVRTRCETRDVDGTAILIIRVEPGDSVHTNQAGECFLRIGDESRKLSLGEFQELSYDRGGLPFEASAVPLRVDDLDRDQADAYAQTIGSSGIAEMLAARDLITRRGDLTVAASLLFDSRPQREYPSAYVRVLRYDGDDRGLGSAMTLREDLRFEGSLVLRS